MIYISLYITVFSIDQKWDKPPSSPPGTDEFSFRMPSFPFGESKDEPKVST